MGAVYNQAFFLDQIEIKILIPLVVGSHLSNFSNLAHGITSSIGRNTKY
jgi:hypothetical protein